MSATPPPPKVLRGASRLAEGRRTGLLSLKTAHHLQRLVDGGPEHRDRTDPGAGRSVQVIYSVKVEDIGLSVLVPANRTGYATELVLNKVKADIHEAVNSGTADDIPS